MLGSPTSPSCEEFGGLGGAARQPPRAGLQVIPSPWTAVVPPTNHDFAPPLRTAMNESRKSVLQPKSPTLWQGYEARTPKRARSVGCQVVFSSEDVATRSLYSLSGSRESSTQICPHCLQENQLPRSQFPGWPFPWQPPRPQLPFPFGLQAPYFCSCPSPFSATMPPPYSNYGMPSLPYFSSSPSYPYCYYPQDSIVMPFETWRRSDPTTEYEPAIMDCTVEPFEDYDQNEQIRRNTRTSKRRTLPSRNVTSLPHVHASKSADVLLWGGPSGSKSSEKKPAPAVSSPNNICSRSQSIEYPGATSLLAGATGPVDTATSPIITETPREIGSPNASKPPGAITKMTEPKTTEIPRGIESPNASRPPEAKTKIADTPTSLKPAALPSAAEEPVAQAQAAWGTAAPRKDSRSPASSKPTSPARTEEVTTNSSKVSLLSS
ncbi:unnamed protein product, partial [Ixodes hexagonus]